MNAGNRAANKCLRKESKMNIAKIALAAAVAAAGCASTQSSEPEQSKCCARREPSPSCRTQSRVPYKLGVARYTMHALPFDRTLEILENIDCHYLGLIDKTISRDATDAEIADYKAKCAKYGVEVVSLGPLYYSTEAELAAACKFAKRYGMKYISVVPFEWNPKIADVKDPKEREKICPPREWRLESDKMMNLLEKYCREYDLRAAVHNHGPDNAYLYPTAESALKRIGNRDNKRLGVCLDVGHARRAGLDPVEFIKKHGDRVVEVHLKNIKIDPVKNYAKEGPRGELDIPGILKALADIGYDGYCLVEYEKDFNVNEVPLAESFGYYRGVVDTIKVSPRMMPVPAGANTLTAQEKAEGYELLFDGKNLPVDKWVGAKDEWGCKVFPARGWYVRDGALAMRPRSMIADGKWVPLPEEDQKMAGGGDIVTRKKYSDFVFKFDFRLTEAANSGIKYFYNEGMHKNSCMEYQVLDPQHPDYDKPNPSGVPHVHRIAALYDLIATPKADGLLKPLGQWNSGMVVSRGKTVEHWLNGVKVLEYERGSKEFRDAVAKSKYLPWQDAGSFWGEAKEGRLLIQDHGDSTVSYCNLKVKEL